MIIPISQTRRLMRGVRRFPQVTQQVELGLEPRNHMSPKTVGILFFQSVLDLQSLSNHPLVCLQLQEWDME